MAGANHEVSPTLEHVYRYDIVCPQGSWMSAAPGETSKNSSMQDSLDGELPPDIMKFPNIIDSVSIGNKLSLQESFNLVYNLGYNDEKMLVRCYKARQYTATYYNKCITFHSSRRALIFPIPERSPDMSLIECMSSFEQRVWLNYGIRLRPFGMAFFSMTFGICMI
ncbi:hypothetical protein TNCV_513431 [Trichonephila clavipes]|nr:hypothetical protein TNCV_513431 [Trichonephila clavipes]